MTNTATAAIKGMKISELRTAISTGVATNVEVYDLLVSRIAKRTAEKRNQLTHVVQFHNELAEHLGHRLLDVPVYAPKAPPVTGAVPSDPKQLADLVVATVGAANIGAVITHLTAHMAGI